MNGHKENEKCRRGRLPPWATSHPGNQRSISVKVTLEARLEWWRRTWPGEALEGSDLHTIKQWSCFSRTCGLVRGVAKLAWWGQGLVTRPRAGGGTRSSCAPWLPCWRPWEASGFIQVWKSAFFFFLILYILNRHLKGQSWLLFGAICPGL